MTAAIRVSDLGKCYRIRHVGQRAGYRTLRDGLAGLAASPLRRLRDGASDGTEEFWALRRVEFEVQAGEVVGIIGHNGAGKSTLLKILSRITKPSTGRVEIRGRVGSLLEVGTGFHPELTGRENVYLNGSILGFSRGEIGRIFESIVDFAGVDKFLDTPVKRYSSGMYVRLAFAVAVHLRSEILLVDEVLAVGDATFQRKCYEKMSEISKAGRTVLLVSHNLSSIKTLCRNAIMLGSGEVVGMGPAGEQVQKYLSRLSGTNQTALSARTDREGNGVVRLEEVRLLDGSDTPSAQFFPGDVLVIEVSYGSTVVGVRPMIALSVYTNEGDKIFHVDNVLRGDALPALEGRGSYRCTLGRLPLAPGRYRVNAMILCDNELSDHVEHVAEFEVLPGDYYRTGRTTTTHGGRVFVDHYWG